MKRTRLIVTLGVALFSMTIMLGSPSMVKAQSAETPAKAQVSAGDRVEKRINDLHAKLKITPTQEEQWSKVAQVMRENAAEMAPLVQARHDRGTGMNAVEDLKSYAKITEAHAAGLNKFIPVFETLYTGMSDDQKKTADKLFTELGHHKRGKHGKSRRAS